MFKIKKLNICINNFEIILKEEFMELTGRRRRLSILVELGVFEARLVRYEYIRGHGSPHCQRLPGRLNTRFIFTRQTGVGARPPAFSSFYL